jgi:hypothetical protein
MYFCRKSHAGCEADTASLDPVKTKNQNISDCVFSIYNYVKGLGNPEIK